MQLPEYSGRDPWSSPRPPAASPATKRPLAPTAAPARAAAPAARPQPPQHQLNGTSGNNNIENQVPVDFWIGPIYVWSVNRIVKINIFQAPHEEMTNGNTAEEEKRNKKNKTNKKRNPDEKLEEISEDNSY